MLGFTVWNWLARETRGLPYDRSNPVVYDNDEAVDMYTDEYLLALASVGTIQLKGLITSSPIAPYDIYVTVENYQRDVADRERLVASAKATGWLHIPPHVPGPMGHLPRPASGKIEDTRPIGAAGSWMIVAEARKASPEKPLLVVAGAPLTAEADAYLLDPRIADRMVVAWLGGQRRSMCDYNGWADPWAAYIVQQKLHLVEFPLGLAAPVVPKKQLLELPPSPLRDYMYRKHHPTNSDPRDVDGDGPPAISITRQDFSTLVRQVAFLRWVPCRLRPAPGVASDDHPVPGFFPSIHGRTVVVERADQRVSTSEWWGAIHKALLN
jgi:hypothetical protein